MKKTNALVLLIIAILVIIIGGGLYFAQKSGKINLFAAFAGFADVSSGDPAYEEIMAIGERGWMVGPGDGNFYPNNAATRAEVVVGEMRARGDTLQPIACNVPPTWPFSDVICNHWAYDEIANAKQLGIIDGYPDGTFKPDQAATRAEMAVFIVKAKEWSVPDVTLSCNISDPSTWPFPDVNCSHPAYNYIVVAKEHRTIFGYEDGNFAPDQDATRRDEAVLLYRAFIQAGQELTISGTVKDRVTAAAIPGAQVTIAGTDVEGTTLSDITDSTGAYGLRAVAKAGTFTVRASATGYQAETRGVELTSDATINFRLSRITENEGVISGTVRDASTGRAIAGATVTVLSFERGSQLTDSTNTAGAFTLRIGATSGTFSVKASARGYQSRTSPATLSGGRATLNLSLTKTAIEAGQTPDISGDNAARIAAARTGAAVPLTVVLIGTIMALFSLIYLVKTNHQAGKSA